MTSVVHAFRFCVFCHRESKDQKTAKRSKAKTNHWSEVHNQIKILTVECEHYLETFIPRVASATITMCMRNTLRLFNAYHRKNGFSCQDEYLIRRGP
jgi:adenylyl- and sulfurtransferase ThiI